MEDLIPKDEPSSLKLLFLDPKQQCKKCHNVKIENCQNAQRTLKHLKNKWCQSQSQSLKFSLPSIPLQPSNFLHLFANSKVPLNHFDIYLTPDNVKM